MFDSAAFDARPQRVADFTRLQRAKRQRSDLHMTTSDVASNADTFTIAALPVDLQSNIIGRIDDQAAKAHFLQALIREAAQPLRLKSGEKRLRKTAYAQFFANALPILRAVSTRTLLDAAAVAQSPRREHNSYRFSAGLIQVALEASRFAPDGRIRAANIAIFRDDIAPDICALKDLRPHERSNAADSLRDLVHAGNLSHGNLRNEVYRSSANALHALVQLAPAADDDIRQRKLQTALPDLLSAPVVKVLERLYGSSAARIRSEYTFRHTGDTERATRLVKVLDMLGGENLGEWCRIAAPFVEDQQLEPALRSELAAHLFHGYARHVFIPQVGRTFAHADAIFAFLQDERVPIEQRLAALRGCARELPYELPVGNFSDEDQSFIRCVHECYVQTDGHSEMRKALAAAASSMLFQAREFPAGADFFDRLAEDLANHENMHDRAIIARNFTAVFRLSDKPHVLANFVYTYIARLLYENDISLEQKAQIAREAFSADYARTPGTVIVQARLSACISALLHGLPEFVNRGDISGKTAMLLMQRIILETRGRHTFAPEIGPAFLGFQALMHQPRFTELAAGEPVLRALIGAQPAAQLYEAMVKLVCDPKYRFAQGMRTEFLTSLYAFGRKQTLPPGVLRTLCVASQTDGVIAPNTELVMNCLLQGIRDGNEPFDTRTINALRLGALIAARDELPMRVLDDLAQMAQIVKQYNEHGALRSPDAHPLIGGLAEILSSLLGRAALRTTVGKKRAANGCGAQTAQILFTYAMGVGSVHEHAVPVLQGLAHVVAHEELFEDARLSSQIKAAIRLGIRSKQSKP